MAEYARVTSSGAAVSQMSDGGMGRPVGSAAAAWAAAPATSSYSPVSIAGGATGSSASLLGLRLRLDGGRLLGLGSGSGSGAALWAAHSASPSASAASIPPGLSWPARSRIDMWTGSVSSAFVCVAGLGQLALVVEELEVAEERRVPLALALERVLVVPPRAAEVRERAAEVEPGDVEVRRVRREQRQTDRGAVVDRVRHVTLEQLAAEPFGLAGGDVEHRVLVAAAHVALADLGQLDDAPVLVEQPRGAREGDELARAAERVLEPGREQILDGELGDELVEADAVALVDRAQQAVGVAKAGSRDRTHGGNLNGDGPRGPVPNVSVRP